MKKVLIAGATGLIGTDLLKLLLANGYQINVLSTQKEVEIDGAEVFHWQPNTFKIPSEALENVTSIINLAGANINKKWTPQYKQTIYDSRMRTAETLFKAVSENKNHQVKSYLSSSGISIYPSSLSAKYAENDAPANTFLGRVCQDWERSATAFEKLNIRTVQFRTGIVLSRNGGALPALAQITKTGLSSPIGSGKQFMSWIHLADICQMFLFALENEHVSGPINTTSPNPVTNTEFTKSLAQAMHKPCFMPNVPTFALKLVLGERSVLATDSQYALTKKIENAGFTFQFPSLQNAFADLYKS